MTVVTKEEVAIYSEISKLAESLWKISVNTVGQNNDPKMLSVMLFKRLWSHHRGFTLLYNNSLYLEADIVLRSGLEVAISIAANFHLKHDFALLLRRDAAYTVQRQIKSHREAGDTEMVREGEALLREMLAKLSDKTAKRLEWEKLAEQGQVPQLYSFYRLLSGLSSHVTGVSILRGWMDEGGAGAEAQAELSSLTRKFHLLMMAGATLQASLLHAEMMGEDELVTTAMDILDRMNTISAVWE